MQTNHWKALIRRQVKPLSSMSTVNRSTLIIVGLILGVSLIGFADATYLSIEHFRGVGVVCSVTQGCDTVLSSAYAEIAGVPTALLGAMFYLAILVMSIMYFDTRRAALLRFISGLSIPGMVVTIGLVYLQAFVIEAWCQYCLVSAGTSTVIFVLGMILLYRSRGSVGQSQKIPRLIMATGNPGKVKEMKRLLSGLGVGVVSAADAGVVGHAVEDGDTLEENALKKARYVAEHTHDWVVADDSGLFVDALDGRPGVHSARHAGPDATDANIRDMVLRQMKAVPPAQRAARFTSVVALIDPEKHEHTFTGTIMGHISPEPAGSPRVHLPYDEIFMTESGKTFAEMTDDEKNSISHRRIAFDQLKEFISHRMYVS